MRPIFLIFVLLSVGTPASGISAAAERYASIVVVENTGEVLHARHADRLRHPASLTKVMTLYQLFDAIERKEIGLEDKMRISAKAAKAKPSKLGLKAGATISVEDAIRALVTKSANDVAVVIAERLAGGEAKFAGQMTKTARLLGMNRTRFANSSGLPDKRQVSTAHDMAILTAAIRKDFPDMFHYFSLRTFTFNGIVYGNHNTLVGRIDGVDGLKTGYTNASGYNVVVTAERNGQRMIAVVFGGASTVQRDSHASDLLKAGFLELKNRKRLMASNVSLQGITTPTPLPVLPPAGLPEQVEQGSADKRGVSIIIEGQELEPAPIWTRAKPANQWLIQVGAYSKREQAENRLRSVSDLALPTLFEASPIVEASLRDGKTLYRARFRGLEQQNATRACISLTQRGEACFPLASAR